MCCFVAPVAVATITTVVKKKIPAKYHVEWLLLMLWGGNVMLIVDHIINGEVVPYFPFFTKSWSEMWPEILSVGMPMTIAIFAIWGAAVLGSNLAIKRNLKVV